MKLICPPLLIIVGLIRERSTQIHILDVAELGNGKEFLEPHENRGPF
jgi:hypothetical protein